MPRIRPTGPAAEPALHQHLADGVSRYDVAENDHHGVLELREMSHPDIGRQYNLVSDDAASGGTDDRPAGARLDGADGRVLIDLDAELKRDAPELARQLRGLDLQHPPWITPP